MGWICDSLKHADTEHLDLSWTCDPKPASKGASVDFVREENEIWNRHRVPRVSENACTTNRVPSGKVIELTMEIAYCRRLGTLE